LKKETPGDHSSFIEFLDNTLQAGMARNLIKLEMKKNQPKYLL